MELIGFELFFPSMAGEDLVEVRVLLVEMGLLRGRPALKVFMVSFVR